METNQNLAAEGVFNFEDLLKDNSEAIHEINEIKVVVNEDEKTPEELEEERLAVEAAATAAEEAAEAARLAEEKEAKKNKKQESIDKQGFAKRAQSYIESGRWEDAVIEIEGQEVAISSLDDIDEDLFFLIDEKQEEERATKLKEKYINLDDLDDKTKKLNEIALAGGDITELIKVYDEFVNPLEGLDLDDELTQEAIVRNDLARLNIDKTIIDITIEKYKADLVLDVKAEQVVNNINQAFDSLLEKNKVKALEDQKAKKTAEVKFLTDLESTYKENKLDSKEINKLLSFAGGKTKEGKKALQVEFDKLIADPTTAADLIFFLHNPEAFLKLKGAKQDRTEKITTMKKFNLIPKSSDKTKAPQGKSKEESEFIFKEMK